jgi:outer membrane protein TolC
MNPPTFIRAALCFALIFSGLAPPAARPALPDTPDTAPNSREMDLRLADAVRLGLAHNSDIQAARLEWTSQKTVSNTAYDTLSPKLVINGSHTVSQNADRTQRTEISPTATLQSEYGTQFNLSLNNQITQDERGVASRGDGASFTIVQPLMRGARRDIVTAPQRIAQITDEINQLNLKATISDVITQIILAWHEVLRAQERSRLAHEALSHSHRALSDDLYSAASGYWLETDFTNFSQAESETASRELNLEEAALRLDASRQQLLRLLALDPDTPIHAVDSLECQPVKTSLAKAMTTAIEHQPEYLIQRLNSNRAAIELAVARDQRQWDVSLVGGVSQTRTRTPGASTSQNRDNRAAIRIDIPLGDIAPRQSETKARIKANSQDNQLTDARQALESNLSSVLRELDTRWRQYETANRALNSFRQKLHAEHERTRHLPPDSFRTFALIAKLHHAESARVDSLVAYRNAVATLDRMTGTTLESWDIKLE